MDERVPMLIAVGEGIAVIILAVFLFIGDGVSCDDERVGSVTTNLTGGGLGIDRTVECRVPPAGSLAASIVIEPESPDAIPLAESPLTCRVELERDGEVFAVQETKDIDEFGVQALEPPQVPEDTEPGSANSVVSCKQAGVEVFTSEEEVFIEPLASTEIPGSETPATDISTPTPVAERFPGGQEQAQ